MVYIDGRSEIAGSLKFAGVLAHEHDAQLIGVYIQSEPSYTPDEMFALGTGALRIIEAHRVHLEKIERLQRAQFEDIVRRHGIPQSKWRSLSHWSIEVALPAYYADLVVIARPERGPMSEPRGLAESLVFTSGRPVILVPQALRHLAFAASS